MNTGLIDHAGSREAPTQVLYHHWRTDHREWAIPAVASDLYPLQAAALVRRGVGHERICRAAEDLASGQVLEVHSDHDVEPLLERASHRCVDLVSPRVTRVGPSEWVVELTRRDDRGLDLPATTRAAVSSQECPPALFDLREAPDDDAGAVTRVLDAAAALRPAQSIVVLSRRPLPIYTMLAIWGVGNETHRLPDGSWKATLGRPDDRGRLPDLIQAE